MKNKRGIFVLMTLVLLSGCGREEIQGATGNDENSSVESTNGIDDSNKLTATSASDKDSFESTNVYFLDPGDGTCQIVSMRIEWGMPYELPTPTPAKGFHFIGWYINETFIPQSGTSWTYSKAGGTLIAHYFTDEDAIKIGSMPSLDEDTNTVTYGLYPQTYISDASLISKLNSLMTKESNGYYLYDGSYYVKKTASPYDSGDETKSVYTFSDGTAIKELTDYWFRCEPIEWKVLSSDNGIYSLVSTAILDSHDYYSTIYARIINDARIYPNNYKYSDIRSWLNNDFYNTAFSLDSSYIVTVEVDNSASTTNSSTNENTCENTKDKVYLLSNKDYKNTSYFPYDYSRYCKPTDYAKANGAYCHTSVGSYNGNGYYWSRSPLSNYSRYAWYVGNDGALYHDYVDGTYYGVRPAITIKI